MDKTLLKLNDLLGGLISRTNERPAASLQAGYLNKGGYGHQGMFENAEVPLHCLRSVSQRSLSTPNTFLSQLVNVAAGADVFAALVTAASGALPGVALGGTAPIVFNDANDNDQRQRINGLVCIGMRAKVTAQAQAGVGGPGTPFNYGLYARSLENMVKNFVVIRVFHTSDDSDPWVNDTPLRYFDRPPGYFLPIPPVLWRNRDPKMEIDVRPADFGALAGALPSLAVSDNVLDVQLSILVESLWIPNPKACGDFWPGSLCPADRVKNAPNYKGL